MRTTLYHTLAADLYPLENDEILYSKDVSVVSIVPGKIEPDPKLTHVNVISIPSIKLSVQHIKTQLQYVMRKAVLEEIKVMVLGAFSCKKHLPREVADVMREILISSEENWRRAGIEKVIIAVKDFDKNLEEEWIAWPAFRDGFSGLKKKGVAVDADRAFTAKMLSTSNDLPTHFDDVGIADQPSNSV